MRRKIKRIMSKDEGFTLVELLAVIVILGVVLAIAVPAVGNVINKSQEKADEADIELIKDAARIYFTTNPIAIEQVKKEGSAEVIVAVHEKNSASPDGLVEMGYLELDVTKDGKEIHKGKRVSFENGKVSYELESKNP